MTRAAVLIAGAIGLALVARAAILYRGVDPLAHWLVLLIGLGLVLGLVELAMRANHVALLSRALASLSSAPTRADIGACPGPLRSLLGARLAGMPASVGAAVFTPYLLGLLVMLGLLGTFMGLFETLRGAREALTASGDVTALREGLAAPMKGLSRAFGTSAAGVSASSMLGLAAVFVRRAEGRFASALASLVAGALFPLTLAGRQIAALESLAENRDALPQAAKAMEEASLRLASLEKKLAAQQAEATTEAGLAFRTAATEIRADVKSGVALAAEAVAPLLDRAVARASEVASAEMGGWSRRLEADAEARRSEERAHRDELARVAAAGLDAMAAVTRERLGALDETLEAVVAKVTASLTRLTEREEATALALSTRLGEMVLEVERAGRRADDRDSERLGVVGDVATRIEARAKGFSEAITDHAERVASLDETRAKAASAVLAGVDERLTQHLAALGSSLAGPLTEAAKATQAGPEAVARLVEAERDRLALRESSDRARDARFDQLLSSLDSVSSALVARSTEQADRVAELDSRLGRERDATALLLSEKLAAHSQGVGESLHATASLVRDAVGLVHAGGTEMTAVAEMFTSAVDRYCGASDKWLDSLSTIEGAVEKKGGGEAADLLGAYLDQTREVFDHSLAFQRELFTELRALRARTSE